MKNANVCEVKFAKELFYEAFGDSEDYLNRFERIAFSPDRCHYLTEGGEVVSALYWFDCVCLDRHLAYVYGVATKRSHRGRGLCHRLFDETHEILANRGYDGVILVPASEELFGFYERMGYRIATSIAEMLVKAAEQTVALKKIDKNEYAKERRKFLPDGAVIQEGVTLDFLATYSDFYRGDDFVFVLTNGDELFSPELLGNRSVMGRIVKTFGFDNGIFRTNGENRSFAMYRPLTPFGEITPKYFGLALD